MKDMTATADIMAKVKQELLPEELTMKIQKDSTPCQKMTSTMM